MGLPALIKKRGESMLKKIKTLSDWVDKASMFVASVIIALILLISIYGAFFRYVLRNPLPWPLPVEQILMVWGALLGIPAALKRGEHMGVEGLIRALPDKFEIIIRYIDYVFVGVFIIVFFWFGWLEFVNNNDLFMITSRVRISSKWLVLALPVSGLIQLIHLLTAPYVIKEEMQKTYTEEIIEQI